jgi:hypothetical protein
MNIDEAENSLLQEQAEGSNERLVAKLHHKYRWERENLKD